MSNKKKEEEEDEDDEEPIFNYNKFYNRKTQNFIKENGFFDPITFFGKSKKLRKYQFPPPTRRQLKSNDLNNLI